MTTHSTLPPADPRLAFWGIILVALGIWIAINQCKMSAPRVPHAINTNHAE